MRGWLVFGMCCLCYGVAQGTLMLNDYWTAWWSADRFHWSQNRYLFFYFLMTLAYGALIFVRNLVVLRGALRASHTLHHRLLHRVMGAPMRFFETTPMGRILNRFSRDTESIDQSLMLMVGELFNTTFLALGSLIVIAISAPPFLLSLPFLSVAYYYISAYYQATAREIKRYNSTTRSLCYQHFSESIDGTVTIRAFNETERFTHLMYLKLDDNNRAYVDGNLANKWLGVHLGGLGSIIVFMCGVLLVLRRDAVSAGVAGMTLIYALPLTNVVNGLVRIQGEVELGMNSVERVDEYCHIPQEEPNLVATSKPDPNWPSDGAISFNKVTLKYAQDLAPAVNSVSIKIQPRERVGVVGRTGAGNTSLLAALFRLVEPTSGTILIDGLDISTIALSDLRSHLSIIPQEPVLSSGTLRSNLDPKGEHTDERVWGCLRAANMHEVVEGLELKLEAPVTENGENFRHTHTHTHTNSVGQRQLLCLCRALLRHAPVCVFDEATASVDPTTDAIVQAAIRHHFGHTTIITIAHRLKTVIDYDRIIVLDQGKVIESGDPYTLISDPNSRFRDVS